MAVSFVSASVVAEQTAANPTYTAPASIADNDWLVIWHFIFNGSAPSPTPPTGFSAAPGTWPIVQASFYQFCWIKKASAESGNYTVTQPTVGATRGIMFAVRGADGTTPITPTPSQNHGSGSGTTSTFNSITTTVANELVCLLGSDDNDNTTTYAVSGFTLQAHTGGECLLTATQATASAVGTKTMTNEGVSGADWIAVMAAFQPSAGGTNATVTAVPLAGTGDLVAPAVSAGTNATVTAVPLAGTGDLVAPTVTGTQFALVVAPPLAGTGDLVAPAVSTTGNATVAAVPLAGTGDLVAPAVSTTFSVTIVAPPLAGTGDLPAPGVSNGTFVLTVRTLMGVGL